MTLREWLHGTKAAAGVRNLESLHTLALFFPMVGMAIATLSASLTYWSSDTVFYGYEGVSNNWYRHTAQNAWYMEPFAAPANRAYWFAGLGLFLMGARVGVGVATGELDMAKRSSTQIDQQFKAIKDLLDQ